MDLQLNADRFSGTEYVVIYDKYRPVPPPDILGQTLVYLDQPEVDLVLDLGCGTGLSTEPWTVLAKKVVGVEPSTAMLKHARENRKSQGGALDFVEAFSDQLPFAEATVDIVTCSQSFHWMEPQSTLQEVNRVLKPGGMLVIYDCHWPPAFDWILELAYRELFATIKTITQGLPETIAHKWVKENHLDQVQQSGFFRFAKASPFHQTMRGGVEEFKGIALSQGGLDALLRRGYSKEEIGLQKFEEALEQRKNQLPENFIFHYTSIFAKK